jgi:hypothetical protein
MDVHINEAGAHERAAKIERFDAGQAFPPGKVRFDEVNFIPDYQDVPFAEVRGR